MTRQFSVEQIMAILHEGRGAASIRDVVRKYGISEQTFYRWRKKYQDMSEVQAERLRVLEKEVIALRRRLQKVQQDNLLLKQALQIRAASPEPVAVNPDAASVADSPLYIEQLNGKARKPGVG